LITNGSLACAGNAHANAAALKMNPKISRGNMVLLNRNRTTP
jgi:hypothetical protein